MHVHMYAWMDVDAYMHSHVHVSLQADLGMPRLADWLEALGHGQLSKILSCICVVMCVGI